MDLMLHKKVDQWYNGDPKSENPYMFRVAVSGKTGEIRWYIAHNEAILTLM